MGCHVFLFVHHVSCYDICFVLLPFSKPKFVGAYVHQYFFAWLSYSNLLHLIRRYNSTYEGQITDKGMKELPGDGQSAGGWEYIGSNSRIMKMYLLGGLVTTYIFN